MSVIFTNHLPKKNLFGISDVIEARFFKDHSLPLKAGMWSLISVSVSLSFGASADCEGPIVHFGATISSHIQNFFNFHIDQNSPF
ncbi:MAG: hypothetical protein TECD_01204 [Hyphomicrobiaceae bacterium hypho_1]